MKTRRLPLVPPLCARGRPAIPSDGSDGALKITSKTVIDRTPSTLPADLVSGNRAQATWQLTTTLPVSFAALQMRAISN